MSESDPHGNQVRPPVQPVEIPDPNGEPVSQRRTGAGEQIVSVGINLMAGGAGLFLIGALMTPCVGATRSSRLLRDQRQQDVAEAVAQFAAAQSAAAAPPQKTPEAEEPGR